MDIVKILGAAGLEEDKIQSVLKDMKENKIFIAGEENLDIRYRELKSQHEALKSEAAESEKLISELQQSSSASTELQSKISEYETKITELQAERVEAETAAALKVALLEAKATDVDYLTYKLQQDGEIKLGEDGKIIGISDKLSALQSQLPSHFEAPKTGEKKIEELKLGKNDENVGVTKADYDKMTYRQRIELKQNDPDTFNKLTKE